MSESWNHYPGNTINGVELMGTWTDPDFNSEQNAFYYVRAIEIPTPRWNLFGAKELGIPHPSDLHATIQERRTPRRSDTTTTRVSQHFTHDGNYL